MNRELAGTVDAFGNLTLTITATSQYTERYTQISPEMSTAPGSAVGAVRKNGFLVSPFVAQGDSVGGDPPVEIQSGSDNLTVEWTAATPGDVGKVLAFYDYVS